MSTIACTRGESGITTAAALVGILTITKEKAGEDEVVTRVVHTLSNRWAPHSIFVNARWDKKTYRREENSAFLFV
jgi:hypothetical protein